MPGWERSMSYTNAVLDAMPDEKYDFRSTDSTMSFRDEAKHMAESVEFLAGALLGEKAAEEGGEEQAPAAEGAEGDVEDATQEGDSTEEVPATKEEIMAMFDAGHKAMTAMLSGHDDAWFAEKVEFFNGQQISRGEAVLFIHYHLVHHRAKLIAYIRQADEVPPAYAGF